MKTQHKIAFAGLATLFLLGGSSSSGYTPTIDDKYSKGELVQHPTKRYGTRPLSGVDHIIVHHSAHLHATASDFARWHVDGNDWPALGYHFVIEKDGTIVIGNPIDTLSYHAAPYNTRAIGICLSGNFELEDPTPQQLKALDWLIADLRGRLKPLNGGKTLQVLGHKDVRQSPTACPGLPLYNYIQRFRLN
ncbi:MAG: peptidoglycan recognition protein family protein [Aureispira sp.]